MVSTRWWRELVKRANGPKDDLEIRVRCRPSCRRRPSWPWASTPAPPTRRAGRRPGQDLQDPGAEACARMGILYIEAGRPSRATRTSSRLRRAERPDEASGPSASAAAFLEGQHLGFQLLEQRALARDPADSSFCCWGSVARSCSSQRRSLILWVIFLPATIITSCLGQALAGSSSAKTGRGGSVCPSMRGQQAAAAEAGGRGDAHQIEQGGAHVDQRRLVVDHHRLAPGDGDDQRHAQLLLGEVLAVEEALVLAPGLAVVGQDHHRGVLAQAGRLPARPGSCRPSGRRRRSRSRISPPAPPPRAARTGNSGWSM